MALFTAPEVILNLEEESYDGEAVDVWSCGVVSVDLSMTGRCMWSCGVGVAYEA